ncbi:hypothetical protein FQA39_LY15006 [Lamprigera yunnana]|nr:hypothetical protein FQA39_LY15006 [Lamprigera yunnana]
MGDYEKDVANQKLMDEFLSDNEPFSTKTSKEFTMPSDVNSSSSKKVQQKIQQAASPPLPYNNTEEYEDLDNTDWSHRTD